MPSSVIHGMVYSPQAETLDIVFRGARGTYRYYGVSRTEWQAFNRAPSKGTYLNASFKSQHPRYARVAGVSTQLMGSLLASQQLPLRDVPEENVWGFFDTSV